MRHQAAMDNQYGRVIVDRGVELRRIRREGETASRGVAGGATICSARLKIAAHELELIRVPESDRLTSEHTSPYIESASSGQHAPL